MRCRYNGVVPGEALAESHFELVRNRQKQLQQQSDPPHGQLERHSRHLVACGQPMISGGDVRTECLMRLGALPRSIACLTPLSRNANCCVMDRLQSRL